jgi:hypothetical protein
MASAVRATASEAHTAAQPHVASAGEYLSAKTDEIATAATEGLATAKDVIVTKPTEAILATVNDAAAGISERANAIATATTDGLAVAKDVIVTKPTEAVIATRDSAIAKTTEAAIAAGDYVAVKATEAANLPFAASSYITVATTEQIEATKAAKVMLDEGGQEEENRLTAIKASADGVALHKSAVLDLADAAKSLRDVESKLRKLATKTTAAAEAPEYSRLAETYAVRAAQLEAFLSTLEGDLEEPSVSNEESIAIGILNTKLGYRSLWEPRLLPVAAIKQGRVEPAPETPEAPPRLAAESDDIIL